MNVDDHIAQLRQFRQSLYEFFSHRRDSLLDLLDALCSELSHVWLPSELTTVYE